MRIGELGDAVGKDLLARREAIGADLARLGAKLAEPGHGAVKPTGAIADSVRLSSEARAAHLSRNIAELPLSPFPSPAAVVTALKDVLTARTPAAQSEAASRLGELVRQLATALPATLTTGGPAIHQAAAALVRALLASPGAEPGGIAALARELVSSFPIPGVQGGGPTVAPTPFERAAVAILVVLTATKGAAAAQLAGVPVPGQFPAALMAFFAPAPAARKRPREESKKRPRKIDPAIDEDDEYDDDPYRPDSGFT